MVHNQASKLAAELETMGLLSQEVIMDKTHKCSNVAMLLRGKTHRSVILISLLASMLLMFSACGTGRDINEPDVPVQNEDDGAVTLDPDPASEPTDSIIVEKENLDMALPYIKIYDVYGVGIRYIQLDSQTANSLEQELNSISEVNIADKIGTAEEYFPENIYLYIGDKLGEKQADLGGYSVLMNGSGKTCLRDIDAGRDYAADSVCNSIISIADNLGVYSHITKDDIKSIIKVELAVKEERAIEITDGKTLMEIEQIFVNAERIINPSTYRFGAVLTLTNADGKTIAIELDDENDICVIGDTYWYDYGPGVSGGNARNAKSDLFELLG